jgi:conjugal transfer pilus assembly protein TraU
MQLPARRSSWLQAFALLALAWIAAPAHAKCVDNDMIDPIDDIVWDCIFPISIVGIPIDFGEHPPDDDHGGFLCECEGQGIIGIGFQVGFWEPARMIDTSADAWCFPGMGMEIDGGETGSGYTSGGSYAHRAGHSMAFQHYHYYVMPVWHILDMFTDIPCVTDETQWDLAMVSEVRPDWHDDLTAAQYYPETSLMANEATVLACIADAVAAVAQRPIDALYWCMGAWGTTYPMSGHITAKDYVAANAGIAGKAMFVQSRTALLPDRAVNYCGAVPLPIWIKSHWRIQQVDPVADNRCHAIGHPGILWTHRKNPVGQGDSFSWILFRKVNCCVVVF